MQSNLAPIEEFRKLVDGEAGIKVACFDYFDTLVSRTIEPEYTNEILVRDKGE